MRVACSKSADLRSAEVRRREAALRGHLLALILACVLVWYTVVTTPVSPSPRAKGAPEAEGGECQGAGDTPRQRTAPADAASGPPAGRPGSTPPPVEELEWPEVIDC